MGIFDSLFGKNTKNTALEPLTSNDITGCFTAYFIKISDILTGEQYEDIPVKEELCAAMMATLEYTAASKYIHIDEHRQAIIDWFIGETGKKAENAARRFGKRLEVYRSREREGNLRGEFLSCEISDVDKEYPPYRYGVICCDRIYNTGLIVDYEKAHALPDKNPEKAAVCMEILQKLNEYAQEIKEIVK